MDNNTVSVAGFQKIRKLLYLDTYGWIAVASLLVCAVSGIFLSIPYDITSPYASIAKILIANAPASFVRNLHYWSAQLFLIFSVLHVYDHFKRSTENNISKRGTWFRLTLSIAFIVYVMISGFILKADNDSQQARRILSTLLESVPLLGKPLQLTFIGPENSWQIIYIQHVATATIIIFLSVFEHARTVWVKVKTFVIVLAATAILSVFLRAPFNGLNERVMKGPWYFVGLQEILHWLSFPWVIMACSLILLIIIYFIPVIKPSWRLYLKRLLFVVLIIYGLLTVTGFFFRGENWKWQWPWQNDASIPTARLYNPFAQADIQDFSALISQKGKTESCLLCHSGMQGLSESHSEQAAGCYSCHLGDPFATGKETAHRNMVPVPWMCLKNAINLGIYPMEAYVKVGDTIPDIYEGLNAGMWTIGLAVTGNEMGLKEEEIAALEPDVRERKRARAYTRLAQAGAHYVVDGISDVPPLLDAINARLARGEKP